MANTFELIASSTVGSGGAANIEFSSISSTFTDLCLKVSLRTARTSTFNSYLVSINGSTANFSYRRIEGGDGSAGSSNDVTGFMGRADADSATASTFNNGEHYFPNYASSSIYKSFSSDTVSEGNAANGYYQTMTASLWSQNTAISTLRITPDPANNFLQYSTAYLYGVKNA